jgi:hypothetical protein
VIFRCLSLQTGEGHQPSRRGAASPAKTTAGGGLPSSLSHPQEVCDGKEPRLAGTGHSHWQPRV